MDIKNEMGDLKKMNIKKEIDDIYTKNEMSDKKKVDVRNEINDTTKSIKKEMDDICVRTK